MTSARKNQISSGKHLPKEQFGPFVVANEVESRIGRVGGVTLLSVAVVLKEDVEVARSATFKIQPRVSEPYQVNVLRSKLRDLVLRKGMKI